MNEYSSNTNINLKLIDFADSIKADSEINPQPVDIPTVSKQTDIWTFGMVCLDLLTLAPLFENFFEENKMEVNRIAYNYGDNDIINLSNNEEETRIRFLRRMVEKIFIENNNNIENNNVVDNLYYNILLKHYPKVMSTLKECFFVNQIKRADSSYLLDLTNSKINNFEPLWVKANIKERNKYLFEKGESSSSKNN
uniref:Protein kinase domain-containing protein n=1 Tax=Meloidogyne hapla TaxID=6305 RepID=A0A1I8BCA5_MELHA